MKYRDSKGKLTLCKCKRAYLTPTYKLDDDDNELWYDLPCEVCKAEEDRKYEKEQKKSESLLQCGIGSHYHKCSIDDVSTTNREHMKNSVYFHGIPGVGKTHMLVAQLFSDISNNKESAFTSLNTLITKIKNTYNNNDSVHTDNDIILYYSTIPTLYIDDIGSEKVSVFVGSTLFSIIDSRYSNNRKTIITSNLNVAELTEQLGDRIVSRIVGMCKIIELTGKDRRTSK